MKKLMLVIAVITFFFSCKKDDAADPLVGNWYLKVNEVSNPAGYYIYSYPNNPGVYISGVPNKTLVNIESAGNGKYYLSIAGVAGKTLDYNQVNTYTYMELLTRTNVASQQFTFEKVSNSTDVYYIKSVSNPDKLLSGTTNPGGYSTVFSTLAATNGYVRQWKLEK
jgi:hypothetical protein